MSERTPETPEATLEPEKIPLEKNSPEMLPAPGLLVASAQATALAPALAPAAAPAPTMPTGGVSASWTSSKANVLRIFNAFIAQDSEVPDAATFDTLDADIRADEQI